MRPARSSRGDAGQPPDQPHAVQRRRERANPLPAARAALWLLLLWLLRPSCFIWVDTRPAGSAFLCAGDLDHAVLLAVAHELLNCTEHAVDPVLWFRAGLANHISSPRATVL